MNLKEMLEKAEIQKESDAIPKIEIFRKIIKNASAKELKLMSSELTLEWSQRSARGELKLDD